MKICLTIVIFGIFVQGIGAQMRIIPHLTRAGGGFTTTVVISNLSSEIQAYTLTPYDESGRALVVVEQEIQPDTVAYFDPETLFGSQSSHVSIDSGEHLLFTAVYQARESGSPAHANESSIQAKQWRIFPGDWNELLDGVAVVNTGDQSTHVTIAQIAKDGSELASQSLAENLDPNGKELYVVSDRFESIAETYFLINADQPLAITAIRTNRNGTLLWENSAAPMKEGVAEQTATYQVLFESSWSAQTHPSDFPFNPHFSGLIGATHNKQVSFWQEGAIASAGIESMAETGAKGALTGEVNQAIGAGQAEFLLSGGGIGNSPGSVGLQFDISAHFPLVSLVSMLAPSPDWFVGVDGLRLYEDGQWVEQMTVHLYAYDAGTDSGASYSSPNADTNPADTIFRIPTLPFLIENTVPPIASFTFTRQ